MIILINGYEYKPEFSTFPAGEVYVKLPRKLPQDPAHIIVDVCESPNQGSSDTLMKILLVKDALDRYIVNTGNYGKCITVLALSYVPYGRQDRVCEDGESFSLQVYAKLLNTAKFDEVLIHDAHSLVSPALIDNCTHATQFDTIYKVDRLNEKVTACDAIIAPDAGAAKKAEELADFFGKELIQCLKTRKSDGSIEIRVLGDVTDKHCLVVDDICDGGGTFLALANAIDTEACKKLDLMVTHGIFSKGKEVLLEAYDEVFAFNDWTQFKE